MTTQQGTRVRTSLSAFTEELFGSLPRSDQRRWAHAYMQGLLTTPGKKTVRRLAASVSNSHTASQALYQFVNASPWDWAPVREELTRWVERRTEPRALTIGLAVLPKRGEQSCGVHRRFVPQAGSTVNCQVGIGAFLSTDTREVPVDWRLLLPEQWSENPQLRRRARVPDTAGANSAGAHALDLIDGLTARGSLTEVPVVADLDGYADTGDVMGGLSARYRDFVVAVPGNLPVVPDGHPSTRHRGGEAPAATVPVRRFLAYCGRQTVMAIDGGRSRQAGVLTGLVRLPDGHGGGTYRVFTEGGPAGYRSGRVWITNLVRWPLGELLSLTGPHAGTAETVRRLESDFGLRAFEGRSFPGWHHHMTLVSAAFAYSSLTGRAPGADGDGQPTARFPLLESIQVSRVMPTKQATGMALT